MLNWAKREIELAKNKEKEDLIEDEFDYGGSCYESALKAFESLLGDGHSGMSIGFTKNILNRLIDGKPLTPIEDTDDIWNDISYYSQPNGYTSYQCKRMSSLFKYVYDDGRVEYSDIDACYCININSPDVPYHSNCVQSIINEMFPITMPYAPASKPLKVYCEQILFDEENGDFDTVGILYLVDPNGKKTTVGRYFKEEEHRWVEIGPEEYVLRHYVSKRRDEDGRTGEEV